jgi:GGDEF domain-containing protein
MSTLDNDETRQSPYDLTASNMLPKAEWHSLVEREVAAAHKDGKPLSIVLMDIDNLKDANDTFGHLEGDDILGKLTQAISQVQTFFETLEYVTSTEPRGVATVDTPQRAEVLSTDINGKHITIAPGRIGGDEFAVLCRNGSEEADTMVNRIRAIFRGTVDERLKDIGIDVSIGTSTLQAGMSVSALFKQADERLYADKMSHLGELHEEDAATLRQLIQQLKKLGIRPRHIGKYAELYAKSTTKD